jgi:sortase A
MWRLRGPETPRGVLVACLLLAAAQQLAGAGVIKAKAHLAPLLIRAAWQESLAAGGAPVKPWPWADTWPVARLRVPAFGEDLLVLAGDAGNALAFGPGHARASAPLGTPGLAVIGGHRDTHFRFLRRVRPGASVQLELPGGIVRHYRVAGTRIANAEQESLRGLKGDDRLLLVTCYPFEALSPGGPLRYVVEARPVDDGAVTGGRLDPSANVSVYDL